MNKKMKQFLIDRLGDLIFMAMIGGAMYWIIFYYPSYAGLE